VEVYCHYIWLLVENGDIEIGYYAKQEQIRDILTKPLGLLDKFIKFRDELGVFQFNH
jgi:hypothetical protein